MGRANLNLQNMLGFGGFFVLFLRTFLCQRCKNIKVVNQVTAEIICHERKLSVFKL